MPRTLSDRIARISIYLLPICMEIVLSLQFFVCSMRISKEMGEDASKIASLFALWGFIYMIACPIVGRFITRRSAATMMIGACALIIGTMLWMIKSPDIFSMQIGMVAMGIGCTFFFAPFQVFMAAVDDGASKPPTYSTGLYTFSWSTGFALGPFISGWMLSRFPQFLENPESLLSRITAPMAHLLGEESFLAWQTCYVMGIFVLAGTAVGIYLLRSYANAPAPTTETPAADSSAHSPTTSDTDLPHTTGIDYTGFPNLAWAAWISVGLGILSLHIFRSVFTKFCDEKLHVLSQPLTEYESGIVFFLQNLVQGITALFLIRSRFWMYRSRIICGLGVLGIAGILCLGLGNTPVVFYLGAILFGIYSGSFFFYLVFHAIAHPEKAPRQVAINESVVGITSILAPLAGGFLADGWNIRLPFILSAGIIAASLVVQIIVHHYHPIFPDHSKK